MTKLSLNEIPFGVQNDEEEIEMTTVEDTQEIQEPRLPKVHFENEETYKLAVNSMREELIRLVQEGFMTESVAEKLMTDFMFNTFNQVIKLKFE